LLQILGSDAIAVITGEEDQRPEVKILLELLGDDPPPQAWIKSKLHLLLQHDFAAFEDALADYRERGFIIRKRD
jgi:hypothetical protein